MVFADFVKKVKQTRRSSQPAFIKLYDIENVVMGMFTCGIVPTREMLDRMLEPWYRFYDLVTDDEIDEYNRQIYAEVFTRLKGDTEKPKREYKKGYVYILAGGGYCKIGRTINLSKRMTQITPKLPFDTTLIHTIETDDPYKLEAILHDRFEHKRVNGEWFDLSWEDIAWLTGWKRVPFSEF